MADMAFGGVAPSAKSLHVYLFVYLKEGREEE